MNNREVTEQILAAWDDETTDEATTTEEGDTVPVEAPAEEETVEAEEEPETEEVETEEEDAEADEGEEGEEEEVVEAPQFSDDPEVQAFLAKYQGDPEKALRGAAELQRVLGRQGQEKAVLARKVEELEQQLERAATLAQTGVFLSPEQQQWVEHAVESGDPRQFVTQALQVEEFDLARAVCEQWAQEQPYDAARLASQVDQYEQQVRTQTQQFQEQQEVQVDHGALMNVLTEYFPQMPAYEEQMVSTLGALGESHPLVQDARASDPETAARGIIGIYEIARASAATVKTTRAKVRADQQQEADNAREQAVVSSGQTTPAAGETPRSRQLGPGLTLEALDAAWDQ